MGLAGYAFILVLAGVFFSTQSFRMAGYGIQSLALLHFLFNHYTLFRAESHTHYVLITALFTLISLSIFILTHFYQSRFNKREHTLISDISSVLTGFFIWLGGRAFIIFSYQIDVLAKPTNQINTLLTIYYGLYALCMTIIGFFMQKIAVRFFGLSLILLTLGKL